MSGSYVGYLSAIGRSDAVCAVSGARFISDSTVAAGFAGGTVREAGYEGAVDYEAILASRPDLVVTYGVSSAVPQYVSRLRGLGMKVLLLSEHLECHPLARAGYVRLFGFLTGCADKGDSVYSAVRDNYLSRCRKPSGIKVLMNIPYSGKWFVPGRESYMSRLIEDAGGEILGVREGTSASGVITMEEAFGYAAQADFWLHAGACTQKKQVLSSHPFLGNFPEIPLYNNNLRMTPGGGNDYWESGAVRPDLVLEDIEAIFDGDTSAVMTYYRRL